MTRSPIVLLLVVSFLHAVSSAAQGFPRRSCNDPGLVDTLRRTVMCQGEMDVKVCAGMWGGGGAIVAGGSALAFGKYFAKSLEKHREHLVTAIAESRYPDFRKLINDRGRYISEGSSKINEMGIRGNVTAEAEALAKANLVDSAGKKILTREQLKLANEINTGTLQGKYLPAFRAAGGIESLPSEFSKAPEAIQKALKTQAAGPATQLMDELALGKGLTAQLLQKLRLDEKVLAQTLSRFRARAMGLLVKPVVAKGTTAATGFYVGSMMGGGFGAAAGLVIGLGIGVLLDVDPTDCRGSQVSSQYINFKPQTCKPDYTVNGNVAMFLLLPDEEREQVLKTHPEVCKYYEGLYDEMIKPFASRQFEGPICTKGEALANGKEEYVSQQKHAKRRILQSMVYDSGQLSEVSIENRSQGYKYKMLYKASPEDGDKAPKLDRIVYTNNFGVTRDFDLPTLYNFKAGQNLENFSPEFIEKNLPEILTDSIRVTAQANTYHKCCAALAAGTKSEACDQLNPAPSGAAGVPAGTPKPLAPPTR